MRHATFGRDVVLKMFSQIITQCLNELMTKVFLEQTNRTGKGVCRTDAQDSPYGRYIILTGCGGWTLEEEENTLQLVIFNI